MTVWRQDPALAGRFWGQDPDALEVLIHEGEPRRTGERPELCWVRITALYGHMMFPYRPRSARAPAATDDVRWGARSVYRGTLLDQPRRLTAIERGESLLLLTVAGTPLPVQVGARYLAERARWAVAPCDRCGADHALDPPTTLARTRFGAAAEAIPVEFTTLCACGGAMTWSALAAGLLPPLD